MRYKIIMKTRVRAIQSSYKANKMLRAVINRIKLKTQHFIYIEIFCKESYLSASTSKGNENPWRAMNVPILSLPWL